MSKAHHAGAIRGAVLLAVVSVPLVAWSFNLSPAQAALSNSGSAQGPIDWSPMPPMAALALAVAVVMPSAAVGGLLGGVVWRWRRFAGAAIALATAWAMAIVTLPVAAAALGVHLRTGIVCVFECETLLRDDRPFGGLLGYAYFLLGTFGFAWSAVMPLLILLILIWVLAAWVRGRPAARPQPPLIASVVAFAVAHGIALIGTATASPGVLVPYLSLSAGVVAWAVWMERIGGRSPVIQ